MDSPTSNRFQWKPEYFFVVVYVIVACLLPSDRSLWGDEGWTALNVLQSDFSSWLHEFQTNKHLDLLKPFSGFLTWLFSKVLGTSELQLRLQNILWFVVGLASMHVIGKRTQMPYLPLLYCLHPFLWFYMDEVRPYAMQLGAGALFLHAVLDLVASGFKSRSGLIWFIVSAFILTGSSLLGAFPVFAGCVILAVLFFVRKWPLSRMHWIAFIGLALTQLPWLGYYVNGILSGRSAAKLWGVGISNYAFALYEFCGLGGLGPNRELIRAQVRLEGISAVPEVVAPYLVGIIPLSLVWAVLFFLLAKRFLKDKTWTLREPALICLALIVMSGSLLGLAAYLAHWPFWGRHVAPLFAGWIFLLAASLRELGPHRFWAVGVVSALLATSSIRQRFDPDYARDDFRTASAFALEEQKNGSLVIWYASPEPAWYYGIDMENGTIHQPEPFEAMPKENKRTPDVLIFGERVLFSSLQKHDEKMLAEGYELTDLRIRGFRIYRHSPSEVSKE